MSVYKLNKSKYGTHQIIVRLLGRSKKVLDVGCNSGYLAYITDRPDCKFYGIDSDQDMLNIASNRYEEVYKINLDNVEDEFKITEKFETIVFGDVLEHLKFPEEILNFFVKNFLQEKGDIIISLPNVAHLSIRLKLLLGQFDYTEAGILDRTHMHLYTLKSAMKLINESGLSISSIKFSSNKFGVILNSFPILGTLFGYNLIFKCQKKY